jgi:hypothetical protein
MSTITNIFDNFPDAVMQIGEAQAATIEEASVENSCEEQPEIYTSYAERVEINY